MEQRIGRSRSEQTASRTEMNRAIRRIALLALLGWAFACEARPPMQPDAAGSGSSIRWPIPADWKHETFALPPDFAPEFPYPAGAEDASAIDAFVSDQPPPPGSGSDPARAAESWQLAWLRLADDAAPLEYGGFVIRGVRRLDVRPHGC